LVDRVVGYVTDNDISVRLGRHIERIGLDPFREAVLAEESDGGGERVGSVATSRR